MGHRSMFPISSINIRDCKNTYKFKTCAGCANSWEDSGYAAEFECWLAECPMRVDDSDPPVPLTDFCDPAADLDTTPLPSQNDLSSGAVLYGADDQAKCVYEVLYAPHTDNCASDRDKFIDRYLTAEECLEAHDTKCGDCFNRWDLFQATYADAQECADVLCHNCW